MAKFEKYCKIVSRFADIADFITIYIDEAHAIDGWAVPDNYNIANHKKFKDRQEAAQLLLKERTLNHDLLIDFMNNNATKAYGGLYDRLYVIKDGICMYQGKMGPIGYDLNELNHFLENYSKTLG